MHKKLRQRIIQKLAQTTPAQPTTTNTATPAVTTSPPAVPASLFTYLPKGYNPNTIQVLQALVSQLNIAMHYASNGKDNFQKLIDNNLDPSATVADQKSVDGVARQVFDTFFNKKNDFAQKVAPAQIKTWADAILGSPSFGALSQIKPTGVLSTKLQGNLKTSIENYLTQIKQQNPVTQ